MLTQTISISNSNLKLYKAVISFQIDKVERGNGLNNMKKRAELINAIYNLESSTGKGTTLTLIYPYKLES